MLETIKFLGDEKASLQNSLVEYSKEGNSFAIEKTNEKLKYINTLIGKASEKYNNKNEHLEQNEN